MIQAIIFDCFGVLVTEEWEQFCYKYFNDNPRLLEEAHDLGGQLNLGKITYDEFFQKVAKLANITVTEAKDFIDNNKTNLQLFDYIEHNLKSAYKIGMLSNAGDNWLDEMFTKDQLNLFDDILLSYKVGITKPDPKIFNLAVKRLNVLPSECVFVDDLQRHVNGAKQAGMQTIWYQNFGQMKAELEKLLADDVSS